MSCLKETCTDSGSPQKALRNWGWLLRLMLIGAPWKNSLVPFLHGSWQSFQVAFLGDGKGRPWGHFGGPREPEEFTPIYRYCRQMLMATMWLGFSAMRLIWRFLMKFQQSRYIINCCSCRTYANHRPNLLKLDLGNGSVFTWLSLIKWGWFSREKLFQLKP